MRCPECTTLLDDLLDFDADDRLHCPTCSRPFTPLDIWLMPVETSETHPWMQSPVEQWGKAQRAPHMQPSVVFI